MNKLNTKGFAITSFLYSIFLLIILFIVLILLLIGNSSLNYFEFQKQIKENLDEGNYTSELNEYIITFEEEYPVIKTGEMIDLLEDVKVINRNQKELDNEITYTSMPSFDNKRKGKYIITYQSTIEGKTITKKRIITVKEETYEEDIYITDVTLYDSVSIDKNKVHMNYSKKTLSPNIVLSNNSNSSVTFTVTLYNNMKDDYIFTNTLFNNNTNISFELINLEKGDIIKSKQYHTFQIRFFYKNTITTENILKNDITLEFKKTILWNVGAIEVGRSGSINTTIVDEYKTLTKNEIFFEVNEILVPELAYGTINFTKSYNASTGVFTVDRNSITGQGLIMIYANVKAVTEEVVLVGSATGGYTITIDCKNVKNWNKKTKDDFYVDYKSVEIPEEAFGTMTFSKSYNASTGILTLTRTSIQGTGIILFTVDVYSFPF